jgi:hypothetical protein
LLLCFCLCAGSQAAASSWNPALLVNTEAFQTIDDTDASANVMLQFGDTLSKTLTYNRALSRFEFNDDLYVSGSLRATGSVSGALLRANNLIISGAVLFSSGNTVRQNAKGTSGQVLIAQGTNAPAWRTPTTAMVWYLDGTIATGSFQGAIVTMPFGFRPTGVQLRIKGAPSGSALTIDIAKDGTSIFSTQPQINDGATTGGGNAVFSTAVLPQDAEISLSITQVGSGFAGSGLTVLLSGTRSY